jgi:hypothetical protein
MLALERWFILSDIITFAIKIFYNLILQVTMLTLGNLQQMPKSISEVKKQTRTLTIDQITKVKDIYRRYRDLNIILLTGVWALAAVEANVSAHLITFDMSEDISFRFEPDASFNPFTGNLYGVKAIIPIK